MIVFLFGIGKPDSYVITRSLYEQEQKSNSLYDLKQTLSPKGKSKIYTHFKTPEPFLTDAVPGEKDKKSAKKLMAELTISQNQANELVLAKKKGAKLTITKRQLWLTKVAKKAGIKTKVFR